MTAGRLAAFTGVALAILLFVRGARADATLVVLAQGPAADVSPAAAEIVNRMRGELVADGFRVADAALDSDRVAQLLRAARDARADVAAGLFVDGPDGGVELLLLDAISGRTSLRRPPPWPDAPGPEVIARRAVDFLRAALLDFVVESLRTAAAKAPTPPPMPEKRVAAPSPQALPALRVGLELGAEGLFGFQGVGPAVAPMAGAALAIGPVFGLRATAAWLATRPTVRAATGDAEIAQGAALLEGTATLVSLGRLRLRGAAGAGVYYVGVHGNASPPAQGQSTSTVAAAVDAGLGLAVLLTAHFEAVLDVRVLVSEPGVVVRLVDAEPARLGRPTVTASLTIAAWL